MEGNYASLLDDIHLPKESSFGTATQAADSKGFLQASNVYSFDITVNSSSRIWHNLKDPLFLVVRSREASASMSVLPLRFKDSSLEEAYHIHLTNVLQSNIRIWAVLGTLLILFFWLFIGLSTVCGHIVPINDFESKGFHVMQAIDILALSVLLILPNIFKLRKFTEEVILAVFLTIITSFGIWGIISAAVTPIQIPISPLTLMNWIKFKFWADAIAMCLSVCTLFSVDLCLQIRTRKSWILHVYTIVVMVVIYAYEVYRFDSVLELNIIVYVQASVLVCAGAIGFAGRYLAEATDRSEFYKLIKGLKRIRKAERELAARRQKQKGYAAVEEVIDFISRTRQLLSTPGIEAVAEGQTLLTQCLEVLSNTENLYSVRFAAIGHDNEEVIQHFVANPKGPGPHRASRVHFSSDTASMVNALAPTTMDKTSFLNRRASQRKVTNSSSSAPPNLRSALREPSFVRRSAMYGPAELDPSSLKETYLKSVPEILPSDTSLFTDSIGSDWSFDILGVAKTFADSFLVRVGSTLLNRYRDDSMINDERTLARFLWGLQSLYLPNPYHNKTHGAAVAHYSVCICRFLGIFETSLLTPLEQIAVIVGALSHDIGHPGRNNQFFVETIHPLTIIYNDQAVLENYHSSLLFRMLDSIDCNIFENLSLESYKLIRSRLIDLILATDMRSHFEHISKFRVRRSNPDFDISISSDDAWAAVRLSIKMADLAHAAVEWNQHVEWSWRVTEEFYQQGDEEAALGLAITPLCDRRNNEGFAKGQKGFIQFVVQPLLKELCEIADPMSQLKSECERNLLQNIDQWDVLVQKNEVLVMPEEIASLKTHMSRFPGFFSINRPKTRQGTRVTFKLGSQSAKLDDTAELFEAIPISNETTIEVTETKDVQVEESEEEGVQETVELAETASTDVGDGNEEKFVYLSDVFAHLESRYRMAV